jgi:NADH-quinone oxidoreductase subunit I
MKTFITGLKITFSHFKKALFGKSRKASFPKQDDYFSEKNNEGIFTLNYPHEKMPLPDHARYELHNEIDDCILCDKCAEICPVNCIEIESIRSSEAVGFASDGSPIRFYAAKFDIDMAKCCFCGLCTTVCPTECLTMTPNYETATFSLAEMNFEFSKMLPEEIEKRKKEWEEFQEKKKKPAVSSADTKKTENESESKAKNENAPPAAQEPAKPKIKIKIQPKKKDE